MSDIPKGTKLLHSRRPRLCGWGDAVTIATCKRKRRYDTKAEAEWARLA